MSRPEHPSTSAPSCVVEPAVGAPPPPSGLPARPLVGPPVPAFDPLLRWPVPESRPLVGPPVPVAPTGGHAASSAGPVDLRVDLDAVDALVRKLAIVGDILTRRRPYLPDAADIGSLRVWQAVHDFQHGWARGQQRIAENVTCLHKSASDVVDAYREQEHDLAASAQVQR
ncbi:MAG: hypothetical protein U0Q15_03230 [Kineosporiaceae bacterium]